MRSRTTVLSIRPRYSLRKDARWIQGMQMLLLRPSETRLLLKKFYVLIGISQAKARLTRYGLRLERDIERRFGGL